MRTNYDWMVQYTRETEWIEKGGKLLWLAFVLGGLGSGLYILSLYINNVLGAFIGWVIIVVLKGGLHVVELGKPERAWRVITNLQTSWISRGTLFVGGFGLFGFLQWIPGLFPWLPWGSDSVTLKTIAGILAFLVMVYPGFTLSYVRAISLWNSALTPIMFISYAFFAGFGLSLLTTGVNSQYFLFLNRGFLLSLISTGIITAVFLMNVSYSSEAGKESIRMMTRGEATTAFYLGAVVCGFGLPLIYSFYSSVTHSPSLALLIIGVIGQIIGSFSVIYCLLRTGLYVPLVPGVLAVK